MSPTVLRTQGYRFYFFSREEPRAHVHVSSPAGEAKFWLVPLVALADWHGFRPADLREIEVLVQEHRDDFLQRWNEHFGR